MNDPVLVAIIVAAGSAVNAIIGLMNNSLARRADERSERNAKHIEETKLAISTLEKNTNSIKDALVKVTGEKEFAAGKLQGGIEEKAQRAGTRTEPD
jgi:hypothetical protein